MQKPNFLRPIDKFIILFVLSKCDKSATAFTYNSRTGQKIIILMIPFPYNIK